MSNASGTKRKAVTSAAKPAKKKKTGETSGEIATNSQPLENNSGTLAGSDVNETEPVSPAAISAISGKDMLQKLRTHVQQHLEESQVQALEKFVRATAKATSNDDDLQQTADRMVLDFKTKEITASGGSLDGLVDFSGDVSSRIGLIMHYPTFLKSTNDFLDEHNPCVQRFIRKGLDSETCFGFDWHWRKEHSMGGKKCPKSQYERDVIGLHDDLSMWTSRVRIQVADGREIEFLLHWNDALDKLERIAFKCCHPDGMFRASGNEAALRACTIDSGLNLLFQVANLPTNEQYFCKFNRNRNLPVQDARAAAKKKRYLPFPSIDPIKETHAIIGKELEEDRVFAPAEINPLLLNWATAKYPTIDIDWRLDRGTSVAEAIRDEIAAGISAGKQRQALSADKGPGTLLARAGPSAKEPKHRWWNGRYISYKPAPGEKEDRTWIKFHVQKGDRFWTYKFTFQRSVNGRHFEDLSGKVKIFFGERGIYLRRPTSRYDDGPIIWERAYSVLERMADGPALVAHAREEYENAIESDD
ncbi:hypothetical protein KC332_g12482 [Hortaea werneckii]|nr:hypothetical protein KC350_g9570 [Hortaea werneckii]KAI6848746.1 hypothetical protein KC358_g1574 [Hortaea werneckii]KAI6919975.1 hypothetical protein KC341_g16919 [Hortaea werneckii]KAI6928954.1 hypothetical protein KC348_g7995 [Hortaea werneckii]KAI6969112.1 hypothetical protein KC321_g8085 [Hortaea werneckii]